MEPGERDSAYPSLSLLFEGEHKLSTPLRRPMEVGRQRQGEAEPFQCVPGKAGYDRLIITGLKIQSIPREQMELESLNDGRVIIRNIHASGTFTANGVEIRPKTEQIVPLPVTIDIAPVRILITPPGSNSTNHGDSSLHFTRRSMLRRPNENIKNLDEAISLGRHFDPTATRLVSLETREQADRKSINSDTVQQLTQISFVAWLNKILYAYQLPFTAPNFYEMIASTINEFIDMDRAEVILWNRERQVWDFSEQRRHFAKGSAGGLPLPSKSMLEMVRRQKQTVIYPEMAPQMQQADSLRILSASIACPILGENEEDEIEGVLYADRFINDPFQASFSDVAIAALEILANAIASRLTNDRREKLVAQYTQFFSPSVTAAIQKNPHLLQGEDCEITSLFCDIRGFSRVTERIGSARAMNWVHKVLSELSRHVIDSDGVLVDYVGDELFAIWGAPNKIGNHAELGARTALKMANASASLSQEWKEDVPEGVRFGIGLCTGPARVGNTGSTYKFKYGPMGKTVNLGSRIQGLTKFWQVDILTDEATVKELGDSFLWRRLCRAQVVGMNEEIQLYELFVSVDDHHRKLKGEYEHGLEEYESGRLSEAAKIFGELAQKYPDDTPSLQMLVRTVNALSGREPYSVTWIASSK